MSSVLVYGSSALEQHVRDCLPEVEVEGCAALELERARRASAVCVGEQPPSVVAALVHGLRGSGVPLVVLTPDTTPLSVVRWLRLGAADVCAPLMLSATLLDDAAQVGATVVERLLHWARREQLNGELRALPGTPLEGTASFRDGALCDARFCWLLGEAALAEMLAMEEVELTFADASQAPAPPTPLDAARVLVVEDDADIRHLLARLIERAGFKVTEASDGLVAWEALSRERFDVVVSDLDLPRLDGWGLLRLLRDDPTTRELPVVLLSAHGDAVMTLKAARAGARAYLKKTGRSRELVDALVLLAAPRQRFRAAVRSGFSLPVELPPLGASWVLETLAELDACGRLELEDALGRYEVTLREGRLVEAVAQTGSLRVTGTIAIEAMLCSAGRGRFSFCDVPPPAVHAPWLFDVVAQVNRARSLAAVEQQREVMHAPRRLRVDAELAALYERVATRRELRLLEALKDPPESLEALASMLETPASDVSRLMGELLRRGVLAEARE